MNQIYESDIFIPQGTDWSYTFPIDPAINLSSASAAMMIRTRFGSTFIATLTTANNGLVIDAGNNTVTAAIANAASAAFIPGDYVFDIKVLSGNLEYRTNYGNAIVGEQITYITPPVSTGINITTESGQNITTESGQNITED